ncbi:type IV secretory system conjugative DNA transfer family protein [uncultured Roseobacter sp.]|uniref:type IV secretory system conjugative DNA transfer family protein n=1 Tax=uncultured Roseobacter sp. TaxID=114847 RepID=UPI002601770F|nr:type IV secretory system conjugative DNA transfer family protein [uncultured Roseobacter sp.]
MPMRSIPFPPDTAALKYPPNLPDDGLIVGWSMETEHARSPVGFSFGDPAVTPADGFIDPILMEDEGHLITVASTGAGKGVGCIIPALLRHQGPVIVVDPKGENAAVTARARRERGENVVVLDPMGITREDPGGFNPLDLIRPERPESVDEAAALVMALLPNSIDSAKNQFWVSRAQQLLLGIVLHVVTDLPKEKQTLSEVRRVVHELTANQKLVAKRLKNSRHPEVRLIEGALSIGASETLGGIIAFAQEGIDFVRGPLIQHCLERTTFDIDEIVTGGPTSIYIVMPPHMLQSHGRVLRLWIGSLIQLILRRRSKPSTSTLFILDEAAQLGTLEQLRTAITLLRGYGLQTWSFWQDVSQLKTLYPLDWQTMVNNSRVFQAFGANNLGAAEDMAGLVGFISGRQFLEMEQGEMLLQIAGDEAVVARLPNYLTDPVFAGQFDPNPFFDPDQDPLPPPRMSRTYLRETGSIADSSPPARARLKPNALDSHIFERVTRELSD